MKKTLLNLQLFADGDGAGAAQGMDAGNGATAETKNAGVAGPVKGRKGNELANVKYGKQEEQNPVSDDYSKESKLSDVTRTVETKESEEKAVAFENLIKGDYKAEFDSRVQKIVQSRIGEMKGLQKQVDEAKPLISMIAKKYGVEEGNTKAILEAIEKDDSWFQDEAARRGMSVEQFREVQKMEMENQKLREAIEANERQKQGMDTYNRWMNESKELQEKYGLQGFDFEEEIQNPDFVGLLKSGVSVEGAYKAVHFDEMLGGAMAATSHAVGQKIAKNIASRASRPAEGAISSQPGVTVKADVHKLTKADRQEIARRVAHGEIISF